MAAEGASERKVWDRHWHQLEVNRLRSDGQARDLLRPTRIEPLAVELTSRDGFIHLVVDGRRAPR